MPKSGTFGSPDGVSKTSREENGTSSGCHGILRMTSSRFSKDVIVLCGQERQRKTIHVLIFAILGTL